MKIWNVASELHIPKNMTLGSNSPSEMVKMAFHWSSSLMRTLLYSHCISPLYIKFHEDQQSLKFINEVREKGGESRYS